MEGTYENERVLETRRSKKLSKKPLSPTNSDGSCVSSETSNDSNFEYFATLDNANINNNVTNTNGDNHKLVEVEEFVQKLESFAENEDKNANFEGNNVAPAESEETNGFSAHQNGSSVVHFVPESNGVNKEVDVVSNGSCISKSSGSAAGLKYVESLFGESSNGVITSDALNAENGTISSQNQNAGVHRAKEVEEYEVEEYDVERVIRKQETHHLICPYCSSYITKRVILRRKRKFDEVSTGEEPPTSGLDQGGLPEIEQPPPVDGISCFSCFSIFIPNGEGFLSWRFKPKPDVAWQPDGTSTDAEQADDSQSGEGGNTETKFPLWVVTCCQPAEREKPDGTKPSQSGGIKPDNQVQQDIEDSLYETQPLLPLSDGHTPVEGPQHGVGTALQNKPLTPINPYGGTTSSEGQPPTNANAGSNFPLWFLTCCQPSKVEKITDHPENPDATMPSQKIPSPPSDGTETDQLAKPDGIVTQRQPPSAPSGGTKSPTTPCDDAPIIPLKPEHHGIHVPGTSKPVAPINPNDGIPLPPRIGSPPAPGNGILVMSPEPQPPIIQPNSHGAGPLIDVETGLGLEPLRAGVTGVDIIKAIVYGGLLESITSLSVITSAAGGDATTLNIVALGLANVFGGLVVLVHNLRVLKHEHGSEHYKAQLGRPGHYMLHAILAIISYLVFGLMSPLIYGFTFRKSDNKDYKLATLAASALAGITILSAAKAYVRNPPKGYIKTVFYYLSLGFMVSGLGYVAGDVINMLMKKLGIFDPSAPDNVPVPAAGLLNGAWSSY